MADINEAKRLVLEQYELEYQELGLLIARLRRDLGITPQEKLNFDAPLQNEPIQGNSGGVNLHQAIKPGDLFGLTQMEAVKRILQLNNKQPVALQDIASLLHRGKATDNLIEGSALRNLSSVLSRSDEFISVARGRWGLCEWYPTRAKKARKPKDSAQEEQLKNGEGVDETP